jgi:ABC-2 type transport system permease protein
MSDAPLQAQRPWTRTFAWLVRRELWEHPAIWIAPVAAAGFAALVHFLTALGVSDAERARSLAGQSHPFMGPYVAASLSVLVIGLLVGVLYCLEALQGERRDRSLLFWKSLPVSDRLTVLSKFAVPAVLIPLVCLIAIVAANIVMLGMQSLAWLGRSHDPALLWAQLDLPFLWIGLVYALPFVMLWYAPVWAWVLLVSAWARRMVQLWALAPLLAVLVVEHTAFSTTGFHWAAERWLAGGILHPFSHPPAASHAHGHTLPPPVTWITSLSELDPLRLYTLPQLWIGVLIAALLLALTVRLRRSRVPL